jgi:DNA-directed RNA polymerase subunit RPC12/RpoP
LTTITDKALRQASVAERPVALPPVIEQGGAMSMAFLCFTCPKTFKHAPTGIETDVQSLCAIWRATLTVHCPHCGELHEISVREVYDDALQDAVGRLRRAI